MTNFNVNISNIPLDQTGLLSTDLVGSAIIVEKGARFDLFAISYMGEMSISKNSFIEMLILVNNTPLDWNGG